MTLGIRKLIVLGMVAGVFILANLMVIAGWLAERGVVDLAAMARREYLTGTTIAVILALLILLVPAGQLASGAAKLIRRCPVCDRSISRQAKYCGECGSKTC